MDIRLKRRLAGGAVLVLLAVIFVPMLFEDALQHEKSFDWTFSPEHQLLDSNRLEVDSTGIQHPVSPIIPLPSAWAVQVGSFRSSKNAEALVEQLKTAGFPAFLVPPDEHAKTLYRVRVGPLLDKEKAVALGERIREQLGFKGFVVSHP